MKSALVRTNVHRACEPILLVHGARVPGIASFDLPVAGGSLAADLADKGFCAYVIDIRGYGNPRAHPKWKNRPKSILQSFARWMLFVILTRRWI